MSIEVACRCGRVIRAKRELTGKRVRCPGCRQTVLVEAPSLVEDLDVVEPTPVQASPPLMKPPAASRPVARTTIPLPPQNPLFPDTRIPAALPGQPVMYPLNPHKKLRPSGSSEQSMRTVAMVGGVLTVLLIVGLIAATLLRTGEPLPVNGEIADKPQIIDQPAEAPFPSKTQQEDSLDKPSSMEDMQSPAKLSPTKSLAGKAPAHPPMAADSAIRDIKSQTKGDVKKGRVRWQD